MLNTILETLMGSTTVTLTGFLIPVAASLVLGLVLALVHMYHNKYSRSFVATLAILPAIVCVVIMAVNGNIGAGVAVAGAFSLVRFRSAPGTAREIGALFMAMTAGLLTGMGYIIYAALFTLIICAAILAYQALGFGGSKNEELRKSLRITIPEDLDYTGVFDEIFEKYTTEHKLISSKTSNMGSMFRLTYDVTLKDPAIEKDFIDKLRCRNGNLEISISALQEHAAAEL
ncbi:protein of unknown function [Ruminococcaceae bacterium YRB3002]|nr:protein of unknown function [Ruminococcaceae bacterium YRB3002]